MEKIYNKLVRDNIPEIIRGNGEVPICHVLSDTEYWNSLLRKDEEELIEVKEANSVEERKKNLLISWNLLEQWLSLMDLLWMISLKKQRLKLIKMEPFKRDYF